MTIKKRQSWGEPGKLAPDGVLVDRDAQGSRAVDDARRAGEAMPMLGLLGGDLCATLGGSGSEANLRSDQARRYPVDLGVAVADGVEYPFIAHVIAHRRFWRGRIVAVMNAQWLGDWDLGPRSHPNDGLLDISDAHLGIADKVAAFQRVKTGTHLPHPHIVTTRKPRADFVFDPPCSLFVDGQKIGKVRELHVRLEPDTLTVVI